MRVKLHSRAIKFLDKLDKKDKERVRLKLKSLVSSVEAQGIVPFKELDIKQLDGEWKGFLRMRTGRIRIIFQINKDEELLLVHEMDYRGDVYK
jgi:mRNA interferase RelE/StbE